MSYPRTFLLGLLDGRLVGRFVGDADGFHDGFFVGDFDGCAIYYIYHVCVEMFHIKTK